MMSYWRNWRRIKENAAASAFESAFREEVRTVNHEELVEKVALKIMRSNRDGGDEWDAARAVLAAVYEPAVGFVVSAHPCFLYEAAPAEPAEDLQSRNDVW